MLTEEPAHFVGLLAAVIIAVYGVLKYRRGGWRKLDLLLALAIAFGVLVVGVAPQVGELLNWLFSLENRAFSLLSFAVLLLFGLFLYLLGQVREASRRSGQLVRALAVREYTERY